MKSISVIVPCYNAGEYIERAVSSFAEQTYKDFEVVFVDDCSSDGTAEIIERLIIQYGILGKVIRNNQNTGPSLARQVGIENSESKYLAFCDSDDWYDKEFLAKMYENIKSGEKDIVFCNSQLVFDSGRISKRNEVGDCSDTSDMHGLLALGIQSFYLGMYKRELFDGIQFPDIRNGEDMAVVPLLISRAKRAGCVNESLYSYFQRENSLSHTYSQSVLNSLEESFRYIYDNADRAQYSKEIEYIGIRNVLYGAVLVLFKQSAERSELCRIVNEFEEKYPTWSANPYMGNLPIYKRVFVWCVKMRWSAGLMLLTRMHTLLMK